jgi:uncharacterized protein
MNPQEHELISGLFERLSRLEAQARDPDAERAIQEGLSRAPHAIYALVQTVLVQDEALKTANARIEQLQAAMGQAGDQAKPSGGFLDNMREALFGGQERRGGSVPPTGPRPGYAPPQAAGYGPPPSGGPGGYAAPTPPGSSGPSFLGTAAAAAAGTIGGSLLLGGIRSMLGGYGHGPFAGTFDALGSGYGGQPVEVINEVNEYGPAQDSPWGAGDRVADQAGYDDAGPDDGPDYVDTANSNGDFGGSYDDGDSGDDFA